MSRSVTPCGLIFSFSLSLFCGGGMVRGGEGIVGFLFLQVSTSAIASFAIGVISVAFRTTASCEPHVT